MTRLFTLTFPFEQKEYDVQITVDDTAETNSILVYVPDKALHPLLPGGKAVWPVTEAPTVVHPDAPVAERLKEAILTAFRAHENQSPPLGMW